MKRSSRWLAAVTGVLIVSLFASVPASAGPPLTWSETPLKWEIEIHGLENVSCPSEALCVGVSRSAAKLVTSTNPTGGASAWTTTEISGIDIITAMSCPSTSLCVAFSYLGHVLTSTNPTGGTGAWTSAFVGGGGITGISCPSVSLCVAVDEGGNVVTSTNPTGGAGAWSITKLNGIEDRLRGVSCVAGPMCVVSSIESGEVAVSTNPTGGAGSWATYSLNPDEVTTRIADISCPTTSLCVGVGDRQLSDTEYVPVVLASADPSGGAGTWDVAEMPDDHYMFTISCPTASFCAAGGEFRHMMVSDDPAGGASAWDSFQIDPPGGGLTPPSIWSGAISCASESLCVAGDEQGNAIVGAPAASPLSDGRPAVSGAPLVGETLTCSRGSWSGHPFPTFTYRWQRDAVDIGGATGSTYVVDSADQGHVLSCVVTATNGTGQAEEGSAGVQVAPPDNEPGGNPGAGGSGSGRTSPPPAVVAECTVPYLKKKSLQAAKRVLKRTQCRLGTVLRPKTKGKRLTVRGQSPRPGLVKPAGTKVSVRLA